jgi:clan AA aspartic protease (TIGR02281 family)
MTPTLLRAFLCATLLCGLSSVARSQTTTEGAPANAGQLIAQWNASNKTCRNQAAPAIEAVGACEQRDTFSKLLAQLNYCHGSTDKGPSAGWTPCGDRAQQMAALARATARFQRMGGVFVLSAMLNGNTQTYFIVDSGAATVQIPEDVAEQLKRNGTLTEADFMGQHRFILADGSGMQQRVFRLRSLQIGDRTMENVMATVGAPRSRALLGQSFLRRLSWWKIDNVRNAIEFEFTGAF